MDMKMIYFLPGIRPAVNDQSEPAVSQALVLGNLSGCQEKVAKKILVIFIRLF